MRRRARLAAALLALCTGWPLAQTAPQAGGAGRSATENPAAPPAPTRAADSAAKRLAEALVAFDGDPVAGQRAVAGGTRAGAGAACFNCHGQRGEGDASGAFPRLAGQPAYYLYKQLENYADGSRPNEVMTPIAVQMTPRERRDVAAYYALLAAPYRIPAGLDPGQIQIGGTIAAVGSAARGVQACVGCHGPAGAGVPPDVPYLAGQNGRYMELQLQLWQQGRRSNDPLGVMADVAKRLPQDERRAVASYFASLPPPIESTP